jgi:hypothetical protein
MSKSAAVLPASDAVRSKVSLDLNARTLSKSSSAFLLGKTSSQSGLGELVLGPDGEYQLDLPPVPSSDETKTDGSEYPGFLATLNLTADERHALQHVPNTFFYMRIKSSDNIPVPQGKTRKQKATNGGMNDDNMTSMDQSALQGAQTIIMLWMVIL